MATAKFYHDTRKNGGKKKTSPLKIAIRHNGQTAFLSLNLSLLPEQWDKKTERITAHPNKAALNALISKKKLEVDMLLLQLTESGEINRMSSSDIRDGLTGDDKKNRDSKLLHSRILKYAERQKKSGTKKLYMQTYRRIRDFDPKFEKLRFEDITNDWLVRFEDFLALTASKNSRNINLRNLRTVFNAAIDDEITNWYPFRKFKIRPVQTSKRSLPVEHLRKLFECPVEEYAERHRDMFKLIFFLIGINLADLYRLTEITHEGRVEYHRAKTGRFYSIKVEPEAMEIIERYRGKKNLLNIADTYGNCDNYGKHINRALQRIGEVKVDRRGVKNVKPLFPKLTTYWARHTWATIAASLDLQNQR